ncbi:Receptor-like serine/threonine-protein kinase [Camellia lanceoleosa]|uniref:Receptor-like serine/threonine-protein kinase n=1 Tax=Camellia lanceoleosa TaxID=1840588 RepID=A0ACC0HNE5_9ERIC|nr:Receptor-like serine/threonine-protein kinase [Camellia lanceoleosa]
MLLVYELMSNGSLQDCLLQRKCEELNEWSKCFMIAIDIAKSLEYLHYLLSGVELAMSKEHHKCKILNLVSFDR